ncbi:hypothetical protein BJP27_13530 [Pseudomonas oryzihabitans]|nr:hypothetical protein BJP27_13530 [Pseudomonas psychrotolerans]
MKSNFSLPAGMVGRFAIVKLWPEIKTAEDECIARLKLAASMLGLDCIEIYFDGKPIQGNGGAISRKDVDFVIHLHYDTPKCYDAFSFVALWNPIKFYHEWGYKRTTRNLLSHDDFLSCSSAAADAHVARIVRRLDSHLPPKFKLYHSTPGLIYPPALGCGKLFYVGINWEAINGGKSRHQEVLKRLDHSGLLRIYGPKIFMGTEVWKGYKSYVREIPFDGVSMMDEIAEAGISLVLSSSAHKESGLMSNRLFESIAAGALVICDENKFAQIHFGDALLYIDSRAPVEELEAQITEHLNWARDNPNAALAKIRSAQEKFVASFALLKNLSDIYNGLADRKRDLGIQQTGNREDNRHSLTVYFLCPTIDSELLDNHLQSIRAQTARCEMVFVVAPKNATELSKWIADNINDSSLSVRLAEIEFEDVGPTGTIVEPKILGAVLYSLWCNESSNDLSKSDYVMFVAPNERLFSDHIESVLRCTARYPEASCFATSVIQSDGKSTIHHVDDRIDFRFFDESYPVGLARFAIRRAYVASDIELALPYLDRKALAAMIGNLEILQIAKSTVLINIHQNYLRKSWNEVMENELLADFCPGILKVRQGLIPDPLVPSEQPPLTSISLPFKRFSKRWYKYQLQALAQQGLLARAQLAVKKLK